MYFTIIYNQRATPALQILCYYKCMRNELSRDYKQFLPVVYSSSAYHAAMEYREIFQQTDNFIIRLLRGSIETKASINRSVGNLRSFEQTDSVWSLHTLLPIHSNPRVARAKLVIIVWCHLSRLLSGDVF